MTTLTPRSLAALGLRRIPGIVGMVFGIIGSVFVAVGALVAPVASQFLAIGGAMLLAGGAGLFWALRDAAGLQRLALSGRIVEGEALGFSRTHVRIASATQYRLRYAFTGPDGVRREALGGYAPPEEIVTIPVGATVHVIVDPEDADVFALARDVLTTGDASRGS